MNKSQLPMRPEIRIDKLLWFLRFAKTRETARELVLAGHIRRNGVRVIKASHGVAIGDTLVLPLPGGIRVITILDLPTRRGGAIEAQRHYCVHDDQALDGAHLHPIAAPRTTAATKGDLQP